MANRSTIFFIASIINILFGTLSANAESGSEKEMYLGVVNGQVEGNKVVKANRMLSDPTLFRIDNVKELPSQLKIRNAEGRPASKDAVYITVKQMLPESGREALITLKAKLIVDGVKQNISYDNVGNDVVIMISGATRLVELRTDDPVSLQIPLNYKGKLQVLMEVESMK